MAQCLIYVTGSLLTLPSYSTYLTTAPPQTITATSLSISVQPASTIITTQLVTQPASTVTTLSVQPASTITTLSIQPASTVTALSIQPASTVTTLSVQPASTITVSRSSAFSNALQLLFLISRHTVGRC